MGLHPAPGSASNRSARTSTPSPSQSTEHRGYAGTVAGGVLRPGEDVVVLPSGIPSRIATIEGPNGPVDEAFGLNDIGRVRLRTQAALRIDEYRRNTTTGSFILIDPVTFDTVAAGMVLPPSVVDPGLDSAAEDHVPGKLTQTSPNVVRCPSLVTMGDRCSRGVTVWFTGLSGSGKSSVAILVEQRLLAEGRPAFVLDGDNLRHGLNADLGFSLADRAENLRRLAHVAALIAASGQVVLVPAISPLQEHRELASRVHREAGLDFVCVHVDTPLEICEQRDTKGLYAKARAGAITQFTGIDSPYEPPENPNLRLLPDRDARAQADQVMALLGEHR